MKRYALVGTGHRSEMYVRSMIEDHADVASLVAMTDSNPGRIDYYERLVASLGGATPRRFEPADLESIISAHQIDRVIVTPT
jgi:predicted dehydrogenase